MAEVRKRGGDAMWRIVHPLRWPTWLVALPALAQAGAAEVRVQRIPPRAIPVPFEGNGKSHLAGISEDGRWVLFRPLAENLRHPPGGGPCHLILHDAVTGRNRCLPFLPSGQGMPFEPVHASFGGRRFIAFASTQDDLVPDDTNGARDIFVYDIEADRIERVSITPQGREPDADCEFPAVCADGRRVVFLSRATNLVPEGGSPLRQAYLWDRDDGEITLLSRSVAGSPGNGPSNRPSISADGRYAAFASEATDLVPDDTTKNADIFVLEIDAGRLFRASLSSTGVEARGHCRDPVISADGRYVVFSASDHTIAPAGGDVGIQYRVVRRDTRANETIAVSTSAKGEWFRWGCIYPSISADASVVCFAHGTGIGSYALYRKDLPSGAVTYLGERREPAGKDGGSDVSSLSADGRYAAFESWSECLVPEDWNEARDVFRFDAQRDTIERMSVTEPRPEPNAVSDGKVAISADGRYIAFASLASNLVPGDTNGQRDVFIYDVEQERIERVSVTPAGGEANGGSEYPTLSADGSRVAFSTWAPNLRPGDLAAIVVRDLPMEEYRYVDFLTPEDPATGWWSGPVLSGDGRSLAFSSRARGLVPDDTQPWSDVFVHDIETSETRRVSLAEDGREGIRDSEWPSLSHDGRRVAFESLDTDLVPGAKWADMDIFIRELESGMTVAAVLTPTGDRTSRGGEKPSIDGRGRRVAFASASPDLSPQFESDWLQVYVRDLESGRIWLASATPDGRPGGRSSGFPSLSADGEVVVFTSDARDLDERGYRGVFARHLGTGTTVLLSPPRDGVSQGWYQLSPAVSADGSRAVFVMKDSNLVDGDGNGVADVFLAEWSPPAFAAFVRGDANSDDRFNIADSIFAISYLFGAGTAPTCFDAADANDDGEVDVADPIYVLSYLFAPGSPPPPEPFRACGVDPTPDGLSCDTYPPCP